MRSIVGSSTCRVNPKTYNIGIDYFSDKLAALRSKSKSWLTRNQDKVPELFDSFPADCLYLTVQSFVIDRKVMTETRRTH